jgi:hypothetical protein
MTYQLVEQYHAFFSTRFSCGQIDLYFPGDKVPFSIKKMSPQSFTSALILLETEHTPVYFNKSTGWFATNPETRLTDD